MRKNNAKGYVIVAHNRISSWHLRLKDARRKARGAPVATMPKTGSFRIGDQVTILDNGDVSKCRDFEESAGLLDPLTPE